MRQRRVFLKATLLTVGLTTVAGFVGRAFGAPRTIVPAYRGVVRECVITCPSCKGRTREIMSRESRKVVYHCPGCLAWLSPRSGDHCIYDSYGSVKCPRMQLKSSTG